MSYFPCKWLDFTTSKEIKRMRKDLNSDLSLKIEIATSIILTIISSFLSDRIMKWPFKYQLLFYISICIVILAIFFTENCIRFCKKKLVSNIIIKGKDAVSLFDEEIVYSVLVACEYHNAKSDIPCNPVSDELQRFYHIEIQYYLKTATDYLIKMNSNILEIFGGEKPLISKDRIINMINLIAKIAEEENIDLGPFYEAFCKTIKTI